MFIFVAYKDAPELSLCSRQSISEVDPSVEKKLLVNPNCHVRVMLEYIRKKCKLASFTQFDLAEQSGMLKGLFELDTFAYASNMFDHKRTYYLIVLKQEYDKPLTILPQLNQDNVFYQELKHRVEVFLEKGTVSPAVSPPGKVLPGRQPKGSRKSVI